MSGVQDSPAPAFRFPTQPHNQSVDYPEPSKSTRMKLRDRMLNKSMPLKTRRKESKRLLNKSLRTLTDAVFDPRLLQAHVTPRPNHQLEDEEEQEEDKFQNSSLKELEPIELEFDVNDSRADQTARDYARINYMIANVRHHIMEQYNQTPLLMKSMREEPSEREPSRLNRSLPLKLKVKRAPLRNDPNRSLQTVYDQYMRELVEDENNVAAMSSQEAFENQASRQQQPQNSSILNVNQPDWNLQPNEDAEDLNQVNMTLVNDDDDNTDDNVNDADLSLLDLNQMNMDLI
jgi:hypothetical protein